MRTEKELLKDSDRQKSKFCHQRIRYEVLVGRSVSLTEKIIKATRSLSVS